MQILIPIPTNNITKFEFHIARSVRDSHDFDQAIYTLNGNVILGDFRAVRQFTQKLNRERAAGVPPYQAGKVNAMGLIDEILHSVVALYREQVKADVFAEALDWLNSRLGEQEVEAALRQFGEEFPALAVYRDEIESGAYFEGQTGGTPNRQVILEEMLMLWLANMNPAFRPYRLLFDDAHLIENSVYPQILEQLEQFFNYQPTFGPDNQQLIAMLRAPALASPDSLSGQLAFIRQRWQTLLGEMLSRLLSGMDLIAEEQRAYFGGHGPPEVIDFHAWGLGDAPERFSADSDWMPRLVLLAKNAYVWLDQLSGQYRREIRRLDQIPDEELDRLAGQGITGLWLIGLWRRSEASRKIKQMMGDPDAIASAYSLDDYVIDEQLGGPDAAANLSQRAIRRGIRLGGDMVPNHMAIDSRWVMEHPHWFLSLDHSPYPGYSFNGPNLSPRDGIGIYLEDHYYSRSDAAVVFKRVDHRSGEERFIYHGNDGTNMPWNDTAQLNFTLPEVREGVIQTILHVARQFPIIRFDAAMTLAKQHIQRLWFPPPGSGGAIPSRAGHGMTVEEFERAIPVEFWREVVDRVAAEIPDTLLLAEAFWMMEGYFVRTLGMHRVYNSAFMHMLRDEDNAKYRQLIKNTLEYNPQILKRYVNFMNNPDEETAVEQFGKGDKYFGAATMMATLPGLPMVGHGQVEGFAEKYGMEYHRAKWQEHPDQQLIERHQRQIFPLFHRRRLFAGVEDFLLYDFFAPSGQVNEDVFAYSNRLGEERALVVYHNRFGDTRGWVKTSAAFLADQLDGSRAMTQRSLGQGLGLPDDPDAYVIFRNLVSGQEYIRNCADLHANGLFVELFAYQTQVFLDFRIVRDAPDGRYARVNGYLGGKPVPSVEEAMQEMFFQVVHQPYRELVNAGMLRFLIEGRCQKAGSLPDEVALEQVLQKSSTLLRAGAGFLGRSVQTEPIARLMQSRVEAILKLGVLGDVLPGGRSKKFGEAARLIQAKMDPDPFDWAAALISALTASLGLLMVQDPVDAALTARGWLDEWLLRKVVREAMEELPVSPSGAQYGVDLVRVLTGQFGWQRMTGLTPASAMRAWLEDPAVAAILGVNTFDQITWFNQEAMDTWLDWMVVVAAVDVTSDADIKPADQVNQIASAFEIALKLRAAAGAAGYKVETLVSILGGKE